MIEFSLSKEETDVLHQKGWVFTEKYLVLYDCTEKNYVLLSTTEDSEVNEYRIYLNTESEN